jgi:hypothetical protein
VTTHSILSPSAASRWLACAGSVQASAPRAEGPGSFYAEEGTAAHKLLELCLRIDCEPDALQGVNIHQDFHVDDDMVQAVAHAYDYIKSWRVQHPRGKVHIECEVWWGGTLHGKFNPSVASGTADVVLVDGKLLWVMDYKHGAGKIVEVEDNPQLKLYACGAWHKYGNASTRTINLVIVQPRARHTDGPIREWATRTDTLFAWLSDVVQPAGLKALKANAPRTAGDHCRWCTAAPTCRALVDHVMEKAGTEFTEIQTEGTSDPHTLSRDELGQAMAACEMIEAWTKAVRGRVLDMLHRDQRSVPGWKLVRGRQTRQWSEDDTIPILRKCAIKFDDVKDYAPRQLLSVAEMEKLYKRNKLGKDFTKDMATFIRMSNPPIHVAPAHDPRPEYTPGSEFDPLV